MPQRIRSIVDSIRRSFPALQRTDNGQPVAYFDGPAGTQVPQVVIDAIAEYLRTRNANHGGRFATSRESDAMLAEAQRAAADLLGAPDPDSLFFGPNMTTLTFHFSRALADEWQPGDEIVVTRLDHDANIRPWVLAAADRDATVRWVELKRDDGTLDMESFERALSPKTKLVAVGLASNAIGTANPVKEMIRKAHDAGAEVFVDAVHWAPHRRIDVRSLGCDYLACSAYKFFGPHIGILWGRRERLERLPAYKLRPVPDRLPDRWMTGTQNHECLAGTLAAIDYLADLGRRLAGDRSLARPDALDQAYDAIAAYESELCRRLIDGLCDVPDLRIHGIVDPGRDRERLPTVACTHPRYSSGELAESLGQAGIFAWHGNYYAIELTSALGFEPHGMLRLGVVHYNTAAEVDRVVAQLAARCRR